jgi:IS5 family transposase
MTRRKQAQRALWEGVVDEDVRALYEPWMSEADRLLEDEELIDSVWAAQGQRHPHSATRGRAQTPAEMVLRLLLLKHVRNWSFDMLEREVRANLVYRDFTRIGMGKVPDAKTRPGLRRRWVERLSPICIDGSLRSPRRKV